MAVCRIKNVLFDYPEGTSVLKEIVQVSAACCHLSTAVQMSCIIARPEHAAKLLLLQNADDAGASTVKFCFDNRRHQAGIPIRHYSLTLPGQRAK